MSSKEKTSSSSKKADDGHHKSSSSSKKSSKSSSEKTSTAAAAPAPAAAPAATASTAAPPAAAAAPVAATTSGSGEKKEHKKHHSSSHKSSSSKKTGDGHKSSSSSHKHRSHKHGSSSKSSSSKKSDDKKPPAAAPPAGTPAAAAGPKSEVLDEDEVCTLPIRDFYDFGKAIGSGAFSTVHEATHKKNKNKVAIKCIKKAVVQGDDIKLLKREVKNLKSLQHENIMRLFEVYEDKDTFYLVTELVPGKELFDKIIEAGSYSEKDAANITRQIVSAIAYLHSKGIAHRDLKPENLLSAGEGANEIIKVADFGLSKRFDEAALQTSCGSPGYVAPEVLNSESYTEAVDMWSIGVILYILLVGYPPFYADNDPQLFQKILKCEYDFDGEGWDAISAEAKALIKKLLVKDPAKRLSAKQMLEDPWLASTNDKKIDLKKMREYNATRRGGIKV